MPLHDPHARLLLAGVLAVLGTASLIGLLLSRTARSDKGRATVQNLNARIKAWWVISAVLSAGLLLGQTTTLVLFGLISFLSLRELLTLAPTRRADHRALFWAFFVAPPLQYLLIWLNWYGLFAILLPVYGTLFFAARTATAGDPRHYLERTAKVSLSVLIAVYFLSHAPALLMLKIPGYSDQPNGGGNWKLIVFLVMVSQGSDVLQYCWGKLLGRRRLVPTLSPNKTVEGLLGGVLSASLLGLALAPITPFPPLAAFGLALAICLWGFLGGLVMSAIKRDAGVKDFGTLLEGHGGITDRIDSLAFAAPIFFHLTRYFFEP